MPNRTDPRLPRASRRAGAALALGLGAAALFVLFGPNGPDGGESEPREPSPAVPPSGEPPPARTPEFDAGRAWRDLERIVSFGPRASGTSRNAALRDFLAEELRASGLEPVEECFEDRTPIGELEFCNVYADLAGAPRDGERPPVVIVGTHFDTKRLATEFQGANDGGSGTAVLLELARGLAAEEERRPVTYRFLFLDGEEAVGPVWRDPDNRYGSRHHARRLAESGAAERVGAFVLLDMVGDRDLRFFRDRYSDPRLLSIVSEAAHRIGLGEHVDGRAEPVKDDHLSFLEIGVPSVNLIDLDYGPGNAYWHTSHDNLDNVSAESLAATGAIVLEALPAIEAFALGR